MVLLLVDDFLYISSLSWSAGYCDYSDMASPVTNNMESRLNAFDPDAVHMQLLLALTCF